MGPRISSTKSEVRNYGFYQCSVCFAVTCIQLVDCFFNRAFKHDRGPVIQRVSECRVRLNPRDGERKRPIERACSAQGVCRGAQVVKKTRLCASAVEQPPPICLLRSSTEVLTPDAARTIAAESPFGPEPIIVAVDIPPAFYDPTENRV